MNPKGFRFPSISFLILKMPRPTVGFGQPVSPMQTISRSFGWKLTLQTVELVPGVTVRHEVITWGQVVLGGL